MNSKFNGKVHIFYDGQAGSCGKGKFVGTFARNNKIDVAVNNNTPNAGHTYMHPYLGKIVTTHIPIGFVNPETKYLYIGPGAAIDPDIFKNELEKYACILGDRKIFIHERVPIVLPEHRLKEKETNRSGSTFKGTAFAISDKITRKPDVLLAKDYDFGGKIEIVNSSFISSILRGENGFLGNETILVETSQGFDLDINHGLYYPYVTSRGCTPNQALEYLGIPNDVNILKYMILRPYPIRISNQTELGEIYCGDYAEDAPELTWQEIAKRCNSTDDLELFEQTTVTKRTRRVFEFSHIRFKEAITLTNPHYLIINFAQYINNDIKNKTHSDIISLFRLKEDLESFDDNENITNDDKLSTESEKKMFSFAEVARFAKNIEDIYHRKILYIGTGEEEENAINYQILPEKIKNCYEHNIFSKYLETRPNHIMKNINTKTKLENYDYEISNKKNEFISQNDIFKI